MAELEKHETAVDKEVLAKKGLKYEEVGEGYPKPIELHERSEMLRKIRTGEVVLHEWVDGKSKFNSLKGDKRVCFPLLEQQGSQGGTLLHRTQDPDVVRLAIEKGANPNAKNFKGVTPLANHAGWGRVECVRILLEHRTDLNAQSNDGLNALHEAVVRKHPNCVRILLEHRAEVNTMATVGTTPLHDAVIKENAECVKILLEHRAEVNTMEKTAGATPLHSAVHCQRILTAKHEEIAMLLLDRRADINIGSKAGWTPLRHAQHRGGADDAIRERIEAAMKALR